MIIIKIEINKRMGKLLLQKLIEPNTSKRYATDTILKHPWITRSKYDSIPKTYLEIMRMRKLRQKFILVINSIKIKIF